MALGSVSLSLTGDENGLRGVVPFWWWVKTCLVVVGMNKSGLLWQLLRRWKISCGESRNVFGRGSGAQPSRACCIGLFLSGLSAPKGAVPITLMNLIPLAGPQGHLAGLFVWPCCGLLCTGHVSEAAQLSESPGVTATVALE